MKINIATVVKIRIERMDDDHTRLTWFMGPDTDHYQNAGNIVVTGGEVQTLLCALSMGSAQMVQRTDEGVFVPMKFYTEGELTALGRKDVLPSEDVAEFPHV
jgi:hypothetical protein